MADPQFLPLLRLAKTLLTKHSPQRPNYSSPMAIADALIIGEVRKMCGERLKMNTQ